MASPTYKVFTKEIREMMRDKRVRTSALFGPIILILGLLYIFGTIFTTLGKPQGQKIHVVKSNSPILTALRTAQFKLIDVESVEAGKKLVEKGEARILLDISGPTETGQVKVDAYLDPKQQTGEIAAGMVKGIFSEVNKVALKGYLDANHVPAATSEPVVFTRHEIQVGEKGGAGEMIVSLLPYLIVIWAFYGGMSVATEMVAGEKEKNTLETLLITPIARTQIVVGKLLALSCVCLASSLSSLVGLFVYAAVQPPGSKELLKGGLGLTPTTTAITIILLLPLVAFFASLLMAVSTYAKNSREAQTYLSLASFVIIMPAMFSQFIGLTDYGSQQWVNLVPILNTANNIRNALLGKADLTSIAITVAVSLVLASLMAGFTVRLFNREQVLVRV